MYSISRQSLSAYIHIVYICLLQSLSAAARRMCCSKVWKCLCPSTLCKGKHSCFHLQSFFSLLVFKWKLKTLNMHFRCGWRKKMKKAKKKATTGKKAEAKSEATANLSAPSRAAAAAEACGRGERSWVRRGGSRGGCGGYCTDYSGVYEGVCAGGEAVLEPVAFSVDMFVLFVFCFWRLALL